MTVEDLLEILETVPSNTKIAFADRMWKGPMWIADEAEIVVVTGQTFIFFQGSNHP